MIICIPAGLMMVFMQKGDNFFPCKAASMRMVGEVMGRKADREFSQKDQQPPIPVKVTTIIFGKQLHTNAYFTCGLCIEQAFLTISCCSQEADDQCQGEAKPLGLDS